MTLRYSSFTACGVILGSLIEELLPEVKGLLSEAPVVLDGSGYICRWRQLTPDSSGKGHILLLEEIFT